MDVPVHSIVPHGVDPYAVTRTWCGTGDQGTDLHAGWNLNIGGYASYAKCKRKDDGEKLYVVSATQDQGGSVFYSLPQSKDKKAYPLSADKISLEKGVTNTGQGYSCGQHNLRNHKFSLADSKKPALRLGQARCVYIAPMMPRAMHMCAHATT